jgi:hypothetical protein
MGGKTWSPTSRTFFDRTVRAFAVSRGTLTDWKACRFHAPTVMEVCSLRLRASG